EPARYGVALQKGAIHLLRFCGDDSVESDRVGHFTLRLLCLRHSGSWLFRTEKQFQIPGEMIDALGGDVRSAFRLGEDEGALENGLGVECERPGCPIG